MVAIKNDAKDNVSTSIGRSGHMAAGFDSFTSQMSIHKQQNREMAKTDRRPRQFIFASGSITMKDP